MPTTTTSVTLSGLSAHLVRVEVDSGKGLPAFHLVGLPEAAVRESRVRVRAALRVLGVEINEWVIVCNLAPAYIRKTGSAFDLAIAIGILVALEHLDAAAIEDTVLLGELSLAGAVRPVIGVLPCLMGAHAQGLRKAIVPRANGAEAAAIGDLEAFEATDLAGVVEHLRGETPLPRATPPAEPDPLALGIDLAEVRGQTAARRCLEIAAAGRHHLLMEGPPGAGKTMLARRLPTILPPMEDEESLTVTSIHSVAGLLRSDAGLVRTRPFRAPHHTVSAAALTGGGAPLRPGEVSLAHHGVLFLDELPEFRRHVVEGLRQPIEDGEVTIARARARATFPAAPLLVAASNPCPCGYHGDKSRRCRCSDDRVRQYKGRLSGPLLDRIDLQLRLPSVTLDELQRKPGESSTAVRARVLAARAIQTRRHRDGDVRGRVNATLSGDELDRVAPLDADGRRLVRRAMDRFGLSARVYAKVRRVARTIADLEGEPCVRAIHVTEALQLRALDHDRSLAHAS